MVNQAPDHRVFYFEPGELTLLLEPRGRVAKEDGSDLRDDFSWLRSRLPIHDDETFMNPIVVNRIVPDDHGEPRQVSRVMLTVTLDKAIRDQTFIRAESGAVVNAVQQVTEETQRVNDALDDFGNQNFRMAAAGPNWLATHSCIGCGGPEPPIPAPHGRHFDHGIFQGEVDACPTGAELAGGRIVVFDTWPMDSGAPQLDKIEQAWRYRLRDNDRLGDFALGNVIAANKIYDDPKYLKKEWEQIHAARRQGNGQFRIPYDESDHGLFITSLIKDLYPEIDVEVYRVLNNFATGRQSGIVQAVQDALRPSEPPFFVLNFSLSMGPPPAVLQDVLAHPERALQDPGWGAYVQRQVGIPPGQGINEAAIRGEPAMAVLQHLLAFSTNTLPDGRGVIAIASAGNDSWAHRQAAPRFPAILADVFGVSSMSRVTGAGAESVFSNHCDIRPPVDGIGALGEQIVGLFTSNQTWNTTGWASWDGTSFAAPIASAFAARLASRGLVMGDVKNHLHKEPLSRGGKPRAYLPFGQV